MAVSPEEKIGYRLPLWFLTLGLLAWIFTYPLSRLGDPESHNWKDFRKLDRENRVLEFAIVGDSHAHTSLSPSRIQNALLQKGISARSGFNFAVDGSDVLHHTDFVLNGLLKRATPPRTVFYVPNALQFNGRRLSNRLESLTFPFIRTLFRVGAPLELQLDLLTMRFVTGYRYRPIALKQVATYTEVAGKKSLPYQERFLGLRIEDEPVSRKYLPEEDGFVPFEVLEFEKRFKRGADAYRVDYAGLEVSEWHLRLADLWIGEARSRSVEVIVLDPPVSQWFLKEMVPTEKHQKWKEAIQAITRKHGARFWDHTRLWESLPDETYFGDPTHMSKSGALIYSEYVAEAWARDRQAGGADAL